LLSVGSSGRRSLDENVDRARFAQQTPTRRRGVVNDRTILVAATDTIFGNDQLTGFMILIVVSRVGGRSYSSVRVIVCSVAVTWRFVLVYDCVPRSKKHSISGETTDEESQKPLSKALPNKK
jgi:hypothetical protein